MIKAETAPGQRTRTQRLDRIIAELIRRIRPVCATMQEELFLEMVERMALIQLKYELLDDSAR